VPGPKPYLAAGCKA